MSLHFIHGGYIWGCLWCCPCYRLFLTALWHNLAVQNWNYRHTNIYAVDKLCCLRKGCSTSRFWGRGNDNHFLDVCELQNHIAKCTAQNTKFTSAQTVHTTLHTRKVSSSRRSIQMTLEYTKFGCQREDALASSGKHSTSAQWPQTLSTRD